MRAFLSNVLSLTVGNIFTQAIGFISGLIMIQRLSRAEYGLHSTVVALAGIIMALADLGMLSIATRDLVRQSGKEQAETYSSLLTLQMLLSSVVCVITAFIVWTLGSFSGETFVIFLLGLFVLVWSYAPIVPTEALMAAHSRMRRIALIQSLYALCTTIATVAILSGSDSPGSLFRGLGRDYSVVLPTVGGHLGLIYIALSVLSVVAIGVYLIQARGLLTGGIGLVFRPAEWKVYFGQAIPSGLSAAFQQSCLRLGSYITYTLISSESASYLGVSTFLITGIVAIIWVPFSISMLPVMTRLYAYSREQWRWMAGRAVTLLLAITLPVAIGGMLVITDILRVLLPTQVVAAPTVQVFIWVLPPLIVATFLYQLFLIQGQLREFMVLSGIGAAANLGLSLLLVKSFGVLGSALATVISSSLIAGLCLWRQRNEVIPGIRLLDGIRLAVALSGLVIAVQITAGLSVFVRIGLAAAVYCSIVGLIGMFPSNDRRAILALLDVGQAR